MSDFGQIFQVTVTLDDIPEGQIYELCAFATPVRRAPSIRAACEETDADDRTDVICKRSDQEPTVFQLSVLDLCGVNDDPRVIVNVKSVNEGFSCEPYTLRIKSESL